jgi:hypothetical protein
VKPCLGCGKPTETSRCPACRLPSAPWTAAKRQLYGNDYRKRAKQVRDTATTCWICGGGPSPTDPWQADHLNPGDPASPLQAAHRSCNIARGNRARSTRA